MSEYSWTHSSALWQVEHGTSGTAQTESALDYLGEQINQASPQDLKSLASDLLEIVEHFAESIN